MKSFFICLTFVVISSAILVRCETIQQNSLTAIKASLPTQLWRCVTKFNVLRCLKFFVLLRLETRDLHAQEGVVQTSDFLTSILRNENNLPKEIPESIINLEDEELNKRILDGVQSLFKEREVMLRFIPNMLVKIVPSKTNDLELSLKKIDKEDSKGRATIDDDEKEDEKVAGIDDTKDEGTNKQAIKRKGYYYMQIGAPLLIAPAMIFAGFLPMLIPMLKVATAFTAIINTGALVSAIVYLAKQNSVENDIKQTVYFNPGYKERK